MKSKEYEQPTVEVIELAEEDIITASSDTGKDTEAGQSGNLLIAKAPSKSFNNSSRWQ